MRQSTAVAALAALVAAALAGYWLRPVVPPVLSAAQLQRQPAGRVVVLAGVVLGVEGEAARVSGVSVELGPDHGLSVRDRAWVRGVWDGQGLRRAEALRVESEPAAEGEEAEGE